MRSIQDHDKQLVLFNECLLSTAELVSMFDSVALSSKTISSASKKSLDVTISIYSDVASQRHEPSRLFVACTVAHAFGTKAGASNTDASLARIESIPAVGTSPMFPGFWRVLERHAWSCVCVCAHVFCSVISNTKKNQLLLYAGTHAVTNPPESAIVLGFKNENDLEYLRMMCVRRFIFWPSAATYNI